MTVFQNDNLYKFNLFSKNWVATSGVMNFAEEHKAHWLLDVVASYAVSPKLAHADYMLVINVKLNKTGSGCLFTITHEVNGEHVVIVRQRIPYTDLDQDVTMWAINDSADGRYSYQTRTTVMFPDEY